MTIKLFVGADPNGADAEQQMVLEYSAKLHCSKELEITWMQLTEDESSHWFSSPRQNRGWKTQNWATTFSGFRWGVPQACDFKGTAIYSDPDVIFLSDLAKLTDQTFEPGKIMMAKGGEESWRFCVTYWNCWEALKVLPDINVGRADPNFHRNAMNYFSQNKGLVQAFDGNWNCVDGEGLPIEEIDALHYSSMNHQFSHKYSIPRLEKSGQKHWFDGEILPHPRKDLSELFDQYYNAALEAGYKIEDYLPKERYGDVVKESQKDYHKDIE